METGKPGTFLAVLKNLCPECRTGKISKGLFGMVARCPHCGYQINQESGYFLGAMMVGFLAISILTIPPVIFLKVMGAEDSVVLAYPFLQYLVLGPLLVHYSKIIWVHIGYRAGKKMEK